MLKSMRKEIKDRKDDLKKKVSSIYFGGGTPSILSILEINNFLKDIHRFYLVNPDAEITIECNPDDLTARTLLSYKKMGINRLSIGVQSFDDTDLKFMNRSHNSKEAIKSVELAKEIGFNNITIDLIYGLPNQTLKDWESNLETMFDLGVQHFSAYSLTIEEKTALYHLIKSKKTTALADEKIIKQFNLLQKKAEERGFIHYEISNFAKEGYFSKHNTAYWKANHYIGIGPSAHSYNGNSRRWNTYSNKKYISNITTNTIYFNQEHLSTEEQYNEYIFISLRAIWGADSNVIKERHGCEFEAHFLKEVEKWKIKECIISNSTIYTLTSKGKIIADTIASDLFIV
mgnify:FL=1|tara:strand:- start:16308 stop:17339 length:1032 start_codon:yes stop_codon:yes gene_type:complete